jgi:hypothetical protein
MKSGVSRRFDSVEVQLPDEPLTPTTLTFQVSHHGERVSGQWLTSPGPGHYLLTTAMPHLSPQPAVPMLLLHRMRLRGRRIT